MASRARDKRLRFVEFSVDAPSVWTPTQVLNPESGLPFTDISAWHFIAVQIECGCPIRLVDLRFPPGATGYEMVLDGAVGQPGIYVKVALHGNKIKGRSFHNATR